MKLKITEIKIPIKDLCKNYVNNDDDGLIFWEGKINGRPKYQREFVYNNDQQEAVIKTIRNRRWIGVFHIYDTNKNNGFPRYELMDGQQRLTSILKFRDYKFSILDPECKDIRQFGSLHEPQQQQFLNHELIFHVYETDDKLELYNWIKTISTNGEPHNEQEIRSISYCGTFLTDARKYFTKTNGWADKINKKIIKGSIKRQGLLETALLWISQKHNCKSINHYLGKHQNDENCNELKNYFEDIIHWIKKTFPQSSLESKQSEEQGLQKSNPNFRYLCGVNKRWGNLYEQFHNKNFDANQLEKEVDKLLDDDEVQNKVGVFIYVLNGDEKELNYKTFDGKLKRKKYNEQNGICNVCLRKFKYEEMHGDHITPRSKGGKTTEDNCQMLCSKCNREKYNK